MSIDILDSAYTVWENGEATPFGSIRFKRNTIFFDSSINLGPRIETPVAKSTPDVAASGNNVYVVWSRFYSGGSYPEISYRRSTDGGADFGRTLNLSNTAGESGAPAVAASGNNVYVVWRDNTSLINFDILYIRSTDGGANFGSTVNISNTAGESGAPAVAASGNNVYVVWGIDITPGNFILYRRSTDGGASFGDAMNLNDASGQRADAPDVAASGNNVYVVWRDKTSLGGVIDTFYIRSTDGGASFGSTVNISNDPILDSANPAVAASNNLT